MLACRVVRSVISSRKNEKLTGCKFLLLEPLEKDIYTQGDSFIAVDNIGAGEGEKVLVTLGSSARLACNMPDAPIDAAIVGIIDEGTYRGTYQ